MSTKAFRELEKYAAECGLHFERINGGGHATWRHPRTGRAVSLSTSLADTARSVANGRAQIRRAAGMDNHHTVVGSRRPKRTKRRTTRTGFSLSGAARDRRHRAEHVRVLRQQRADLVGRLKRLDPRRDAADTRRIAALILAIDNQLAGRTA